MRDLALGQKPLSIDYENNEGPFYNLHKIHQIGREVIDITDDEVGIVNVIGCLILKHDIAESVKHTDEGQSEQVHDYGVYQ